MSTARGKLINYGFQTPVISIDQHIFGAAQFSGKVLNESGQWDNWKPTYEAQADNFETQGCTVWGTENAIEFLHKFLFSIEKNYEELPPYLIAGVRPEYGGDPHNVAEAIRLNGLVESPNCPFPLTLQSLVTLLGTKLSPQVTEEGTKWLGEYTFRHQWVLQGYQDKNRRTDILKNALKYGVVGASVTAWFIQDGIYVDNGQRNTHWVVIYGWNEKGWKVFDSYDHSEKIYSFDSRVDFAKLYFLEKKLTASQRKSIWQMIVQFVSNLLSPKELENVKKSLLPEEDPKRDLLDEFCKAIHEYEGYFQPSPRYPKGSRSWRNNNPGNIRCTPIKNSRANGTDTLGFCTFQDYETGYMALKVMIANACSGKSKVYNPEMSILQFFEKYAPTTDANQPMKYAAYVASKLKVGTNYQLKNLVK